MNLRSLVLTNEESFWSTFSSFNIGTSFSKSAGKRLFLLSLGRLYRQQRKKPTLLLPIFRSTNSPSWKSAPSGSFWISFLIAMKTPPGIEILFTTPFQSCFCTPNNNVASNILCVNHVPVRQMRSWRHTWKQFESFIHLMRSRMLLALKVSIALLWCWEFSLETSQSWLVAFSAVWGTLFPATSAFGLRFWLVFFLHVLWIAVLMFHIRKFFR